MHPILACTWEAQFCIFGVWVCEIARKRDLGKSQGPLYDGGVKITESKELRARKEVSVMVG